MATCLLGLGSNLGDPSENLRRALHRLAAESAHVLAQSRIHTTRPIGGPANQSDFGNAVALVQTGHSPLAMLAALQSIEQRLGRQRGERWGARTLDLDLLLFDQQILDSPVLILPHPRLAFRRFVLAPAAEIASGMIHPTTGFSLGELLTRLDRQPIHVSVAGTASPLVAQAAAAAVPAPLLTRPKMLAADSPTAGQRLEFLRHGLRQWEEAVAQRSRSVISDFWIGECWLDKQTNPACEELWSTLPLPLRSPHLVIWLEPAGPAGGEGGAPDKWGRLWSLLSQPRQSPLLRVGDVRVEDVVAEITAAVEAMT